MTNAIFWDKFAAKYAARSISDPAAYEDTLTHTCAYLKESDRVLEIGCGTGSTALKLAPFVTHITATDISPQMLHIARGKLGPDMPGNIEFLRTDSEAQIPGAPFDAICAFNILHLVPDLGATLRQLFDQIRPGGVVISKTPCIGDMSVFVRSIIPLMRLVGKAPKINGFRASELEAAFQETGFELVETRFFGNSRASHFVVARR